MATKKKLKKMIQNLVKEMPIVMNHTIEKHLVSGAELLNQGHREEEGINPAKNYVQSMPVVIARNHENAIKRAYAKNGKNGVLNYISSVTKTVMNQ